MTLPLTKDILRSAYDYLASTPPFNRWNLPDGEEIEFRLPNGSPFKTEYGQYEFIAGKHVISIARARTGHTQSLMILMAHEMIHLHEQRAGMATSSQHTRAFLKMAALVCRYHGFDPKTFS